MAVTTPGIDFIVASLAKMSLPPIVLAAVARVLADYFHHTIPTWLLVSTSALSIPFVSFLRIAATRLYNRYQAARLGARLAPEVPGHSIGNFDVMKRLRYMFDHDYPGVYPLTLDSGLG